MTRETFTESYRDWSCCIAASHLVLGLGGTQQRTEPMAGTAFFFAALAALVAVKCAARIAINAGDFDGLPLPTQID
jgi:hypothetical protein